MVQLVLAPQVCANQRQATFNAAELCANRLVRERDAGRQVLGLWEVLVRHSGDKTNVWVSHGEAGPFVKSGLDRRLEGVPDHKLVVEYEDRYGPAVRKIITDALSR